MSEHVIPISKPREVALEIKPPTEDRAPLSREQLFKALDALLDTQAYSIHNLRRVIQDIGTADLDRETIDKLAKLAINVTGLLQDSYKAIGPAVMRMVKSPAA